MLPMPADTLGIPPGQNRREMLAFAALTLAVGLAGCLVIVTIHLLARASY
jgi:hypothetical protein